MMQANPSNKRPRAGSSSGRWRSASELFNEGLINAEQKSIIKDLLVTGDKQLEQSLDNYLQGNKTDIINLISAGHLKERKSTFDFLDTYPLDSMDLGGGFIPVDRSMPISDAVSDQFYQHPRTGSTNPYYMMKMRDNSMAEMPINNNDFIFDTQPKMMSEQIYSAQFGNFVGLQNDRDSDYLDGNILNPTNNDNQSDTMPSPHTTYPEAYQSLTYLNNNEVNNIRGNSFSLYSTYPASTTHLFDNSYNNNPMMGNNNPGMMNPNVNTMQYNQNNIQFAPSQISSFHKPPPIKTSDSDLPPLGPMKHEPGKKYIGAYSPESRRKRIEKFLEKRKQRVWTKRVKYDVRKNFADSRLRVKGRFVKKEDEELLRELMNLT